MSIHTRPAAMVPGAAARAAADEAAWAFLRQLADERAEDALSVRLTFQAPGQQPGQLTAPVFALVSLDAAAAR